MGCGKTTYGCQDGYCQLLMTAHTRHHWNHAQHRNQHQPSPPRQPPSTEATTLATVNQRHHLMPPPHPPSTIATTAATVNHCYHHNHRHHRNHRQTSPPQPHQPSLSPQSPTINATKTIISCGQKTLHESTFVVVVSAVHITLHGSPRLSCELVKETNTNRCESTMQ
ncbi:hypothetical protein Hanom_Chr00s017120g01756781 [Helianthus anomalus]